MNSVTFGEQPSDKEEMEAVMVHSVSPDYSITDELRDRAVGAESELAEFKRQIAAGELIPFLVAMDYAHKCVNSANGICVPPVQLKKFAADRARKDAQ